MLNLNGSTLSSFWSADKGWFNLKRIIPWKQRFQSLHQIFSNISWTRIFTQYKMIFKAQSGLDIEKWMIFQIYLHRYAMTICWAWTWIGTILFRSKHHVLVLSTAYISTPVPLKILVVEGYLPQVRYIWKIWLDLGVAIQYVQKVKSDVVEVKWSNRNSTPRPWLVGRNTRYLSSSHQYNSKFWDTVQTKQ